MCRAGFHSEDNFTDEPHININRGLCLSFHRFVLLLSGSAVLQCLCALVCSGRGLLWLWMALCLSQLSPRLPRFSAIHPSTSETALFLCNHMVGNLATVRSHWHEPKLLHSHILQSCLLVRQEPCETYYLCNVVAQWSSQRITYPFCCPVWRVWHAKPRDDVFIAVSCQGKILGFLG